MSLKAAVPPQPQQHISSESADRRKSANGTTVPVWASVAILGTAIFSGALTWHIGKTYLKGANGVPGYITAAVPFFLLMMIVERTILAIIKLPSAAARYDLGDSWSSICAGITQQVIEAMLKKPLGLSVVPYTYVWANFRICDCSVESWTTFFSLVVVVDFFYYWYHRKAHEIAWLWAGHGVHHSSEHYNLTTALRQSWWQALSSWIFTLPAALFFNPLLYMSFAQWNTIYQFWVHTCCVRRLGPFEWLLVTPSHHRVHHDRRVHKNFGGIFIVWDRLWGTFLDETALAVHPHDPIVDPSRAALGFDATGEEAMVFGVRYPLTTWTEVVVQHTLWRDIVLAWQSRADCSLVTRLFHSLWVGPGYYAASMHRELPAYKPDAIPRLRRRAHLSFGASAYIVLHFIATILVSLVVSVLVSKGPRQLLFMFVYVITSMLAQGALLDGGSGAVVIEAARCVVVTVLASLSVLGLTPSFGLALLFGDLWEWRLVCGLGVMHALSLLCCLAAPATVRVTTEIVTTEKPKNM